MPPLCLWCSPHVLVVSRRLSFGCVPVMSCTKMSVLLVSEFSSGLLVVSRWLLKESGGNFEAEIRVDPIAANLPRLDLHNVLYARKVFATSYRMKFGRGSPLSSPKPSCPTLGKGSTAGCPGSSNAGLNSECACVWGTDTMTMDPTNMPNRSPPTKGQECLILSIANQMSTGTNTPSALAHRIWGGKAPTARARRSFCFCFPHCILRVGQTEST